MEKVICLFGMKVYAYAYGRALIKDSKSNTGIKFLFFPPTRPWVNFERAPSWGYMIRSFQLPKFVLLRKGVLIILQG